MEDRSMDPNTLLDQIPVLFVRGTYRTVGYTIGRQFKSMIDDLLQNWTYFNESVLIAYQTSDGKRIYEETLSCCKERFPMYVEELEGIAEGSKNPFYKLFLLHIESVLCPPATPATTTESYSNGLCKSGTGCTSVIINSQKYVYLGHTEDALVEFGNNVYVIAAEITSESGEILEKFTTLTYAGHLPGYTMGFNRHFVYSVNTEFPVDVRPGKTPRTFLTRAILTSSSLQQVEHILRDSGSGVSDGFSLNIIFWNAVGATGGASTAYNIEVAPPKQANDSESVLNVFQIEINDLHGHCNKYLRLDTKEHDDSAPYSLHRYAVLDKYLAANAKTSIDLEGLKSILSDRRDKEYPIYRCCGSNDCPVKTVAVGIFDINKGTWSIFMGPPVKSNPVAILHMDFQ